MLLYNKALDKNHTLLRVIAILLECGSNEIEEDRLRIFDFIVANPIHITQMSLSRDIIKQKNSFKDYANRYQSYDPKNLFESMKSIQNAVFIYLIEIGSITKTSSGGRYKINIELIPAFLSDIAKDPLNSISRKAISFIFDHLFKLDLVGRNGLKQASKLIEHKYDSIQTNN